MAERGDQRPEALTTQGGVEQDAMENRAGQEPPAGAKSGEVAAEGDGTEPATEQASTAGEDAPGDEPTPDPVEALRQELEGALRRYEQAEETRRQVWDRYLRLQADFENFRRRTERERAGWQDQAVEQLVRELLPVLDNLERALAAMPEDGSPGEAAAAALATGVKMVYDQFRTVLEQAGLEPVAAVGQPFDPRVHEAVDRVEAPGHEPDSVVEELQRGYLFRSKLIRPSMVRVAQVPEGEGGNSIG